MTNAAAGAVHQVLLGAQMPSLSLDRLSLHEHCSNCKPSPSLCFHILHSQAYRRPLSTQTRAKMMTHAAHAQASSGSDVLGVTQVEEHLQARPGHLQEDLLPLQLLLHSLQQLLSSPLCTPSPSTMRASSLSTMVSSLAGAS